jgi:hypothetical protein
MKKIANPGSALGEAIGALIERHVNRVLKPIAEDNDCVYITTGKINVKTQRPTKLILKDSAGNEFNIDSVIANNRMQPLVLIESKYIRYKKHNRDKGSWVCTAHYSLRRTYQSIRKSITIIAGSWSGSSKALMRSFDVELFEVPFGKIVEVLSRHDIRFDWGEKERAAAMTAWKRFVALPETTVDAIGEELVADIVPQLRDSLALTLNDAVPREVKQIELTVETNLGETKLYTFTSIEDVIDFLEDFDAAEIFDDEDAPAILF